jgi:hypothetical protein
MMGELERKSAVCVERRRLKQWESLSTFVMNSMFLLPVVYNQLCTSLGESLRDQESLPFDRLTRLSTCEERRQIERIWFQRTYATGHSCSLFNLPAETQTIFWSAA